MSDLRVLAVIGIFGGLLLVGEIELAHGDADNQKLFEFMDCISEEYQQHPTTAQYYEIGYWVQARGGWSDDGYCDHGYDWQVGRPTDLSSLKLARQRCAMIFHSA